MRIIAQIQSIKFSHSHTIRDISTYLCRFLAFLSELTSFEPMSIRYVPPVSKKLFLGGLSRKYFHGYAKPSKSNQT
jgi:hypothetical protein